jgi:transcriptional regulator with XRE-family HTH domain
VIVGPRIRERLKSRGLSQSELARRVRLDQSTISGLIKGDQQSSTKLHLIARELETTPAYLSGETDDPTAIIPDEPTYDSETRNLLDSFSMISAADRRAIVQLVQSLAGAIATSTIVPKSRAALKGKSE